METSNPPPFSLFCNPPPLFGDMHCKRDAPGRGCLTWAEDGHKKGGKEGSTKIIVPRSAVSRGVGGWTRVGVGQEGKVGRGSISSDVEVRV